MPLEKRCRYHLDYTNYQLKLTKMEEEDETMSHCYFGKINVRKHFTESKSSFQREFHSMLCEIETKERDYEEAIVEHAVVEKFFDTAQTNLTATNALIETKDMSFLLKGDHNKLHSAAVRDLYPP